MKFYLRLTMEGTFPGSPDHRSIRITETTYDELMERFKDDYEVQEAMHHIGEEEHRGDRRRISGKISAVELR